MNLMRQLWQDEAGVIVSSEIILIMMLLVFGLIAGLVSFRDAVAQELADTGLMVNALDQSFTFVGNSNIDDAAVTATTPASLFDDLTDENNADDNDDPGAGLDITVPAATAETP